MEYNREKLENLETLLNTSKKNSDRALARRISMIIYTKEFEDAQPFETNLRLDGLADRLYDALLKKLDRESRETLFNLGCENGELGHQVYVETRGRWYVDGHAISRLEHRKDQFGRYVEPIYTIPRFEDGYVITEDLGLTEEQLAEASEFLDRYEFLLYVMAKNAQRREEIYAGNYSVRDKSVNPELVKAIIDVLGRTPVGEKNKVL